MPKTIRTAVGLPTVNRVATINTGIFALLKQELKLYKKVIKTLLHHPLLLDRAPLGAEVLVVVYSRFYD